jgi:hypothetical protein
VMERTLCFVHGNVERINKWVYSGTGYKVIRIDYKVLQEVFLNSQALSVYNEFPTS